MLLKLICACVICAGMWTVGREYADHIRSKAVLIGDYLFFTEEMKSAVMFSGKNMYEFFGGIADGGAAEFCRFAYAERGSGMRRILNGYPATCKEEKECLKILSEALCAAEESSDASRIAALLETCACTLKGYKQQIEEENRAKVKTAPSVALMLGLFTAVLII